MMRLELIVARGKNGVIGLKGTMPWHLPEDLKHFKETTMGCPVLMGRKTWESIGRALPGRTNVVLTRDASYLAPGAHVATTLEAALASVKNAPKAFIIGGANLYRTVLDKDWIRTAWVTEIDAAPEGDAFFPELPEALWERHVLKTFAQNDKRPALCFCRYDRKDKDGASPS